MCLLLMYCPVELCEIINTYTEYKKDFHFQNFQVATWIWLL